MARKLNGKTIEVPPCKYEYLHSSNYVQVHAWGDSLKEAFEQCGVAMFDYMVDVEIVDTQQAAIINATGDDYESLLFHFLGELLYMFSFDPYLIAKKLEITEMTAKPHEYTIVCKCYGEEFTVVKHLHGTKFETVTYSVAKIVNCAKSKKFEVFVNIDK